MRVVCIKDTWEYILGDIKMPLVGDEYEVITHRPCKCGCGMQMLELVTLEGFGWNAKYFAQIDTSIENIKQEEHEPLHA